MVAEVFGGISALKAALDILKTIKDANDTATRQGIVIKLQEQILSAHESQLALIEQVSSLKEKVTGMEKWETEKQKYELKSLGWGAFALMMKPNARGAAPPHWICTKCYSDGYAEIIQQIRDGGFKFLCPRCQSRLDPSPDAFEKGTGRLKWID
jgi:hypothetical protein